MQESGSLCCWSIYFAESPGGLLPGWRDCLVSAHLQLAKMPHRRPCSAAGAELALPRDSTKT